MTIDTMTTLITIRLPFFYELAVIDPNYNVLVNSVVDKTASSSSSSSSPNNCTPEVNPVNVEQGLPLPVVIGITVSFIGGALIAAVLLLYWKMMKRKEQRRRLHLRTSAHSENL